MKLMLTCNGVILWHTVYLLAIEANYNRYMYEYDTLDCLLGVSEFF